ncbi:unnamed protein product [Triticum turgidum subsp. durum]|uniref:peroxidase n=1 Tax=Triticum turgidum subsp. durum TaxID=4567 RepID=A0A9R1B6A3_TRITD|nr:unnamed protein product [Triticum turgidum subsp. durum]
MANLESLASLAAILILVLVEVAVLSSFAAAQLRPDYYANVCPNLEGIVRYFVKQSMVKSPISAPATLRLFFHDCAVMGCDASVMIISPTGDDEWRNQDDYSLKPEGFQTILDAKAAVDSDLQCRYKVSCADIIALAARESVSQLRPDYYAGVCPNLEGIVRSSVKQSMVKSPISAPATLRLFFHDCCVQGCDASVMIMGSTGDDENPDKYSLKPEGFQTILDAKAAVDSDPQCRYKVSCADIIALATRESVSQSGGPNYTVELGRYDGKKSTDRSVRLPHPGDNLDSLNAYFSTLGLSQTDMIALSGGHTLGAADCGFFKYRIGGNDQSMNPSFDAQLQGTCAKQNFAFLDDVTPVGFDNFYYRNLQNGRGLLGSDQVLYTDERSRGTVDFYAANQGTFFSDFVIAMTKLGRVGVKTAADGEIRRDCQYPN